jgi:hypothetical protein
LHLLGNEAEEEAEEADAYQAALAPSDDAAEQELPAERARTARPTSIG